jgi:hypothetical protein
MSKPTEFRLWWITDEFGCRRKTTYRMDRETALGRYPDAEPVPNTVEIRNLPESPDEWSTAGAPRQSH